MDTLLVELLEIYRDQFSRIFVVSNLIISAVVLAAEIQADAPHLVQVHEEQWSVDKKLCCSDILSYRVVEPVFCVEDWQGLLMDTA